MYQARRKKRKPIYDPETGVPPTEEQIAKMRKQAMNVIESGTGETGMVNDYAEESGLAVDVAAGLIVNKYQNRKFLIRKLERLRARHQIAIRNAKTKDDLALCRKAMEEDSFLSMMM
jgi:hypothetical protein